MSNFKIVKAVPEHIYPIASDMRQVDIDEIMADSGLDPFQALESGLRDSCWCWTALYDGKPCFMFGLARFSILGNSGSPWLLANNDYRKIKRIFLIESRKYVDLMLDECPELVNYVDARNKPAIRWLKWLGFEILPAIKHGRNGEPFHPFIKRKS